MSKFDILIKDGLIVDGSGCPAYRGSLGIVGERIAKMGKISDSSADVAICAENLTVAPGFIDPHSHADEYMLISPNYEDYLVQGVTTIIGSNCGYSPAPVKDFVTIFHLPDATRDLRPFGILDLPHFIFPLNEFRDKVKERYSVDWNWKTFAEFLSRIDKQGISINYIPQVGHGTVRLAVMGLDYKRQATPSEVEEMKRLVIEAMDAGVLGMSTGRDYPPQDYADTAEVIELAKVVKDNGGFYLTHYSGLNTNGLKEAAEIGTKSGVPVHISHLISAYEVHPLPLLSSPRDKVSPGIPETLQRCAAEETLSVVGKYIGAKIFTSFDVIPSAVGSTEYLACTLRPWLEWAGSRQTLAKCLNAEWFKKDVKETISAGKWRLRDLENSYSVRIVSCKNEGYIERSISEMAEARNESELDTLLDIIAEDPDTRVEYVKRDETYIEVYMKHSHSMPSTDKIVPIYGSWKRMNPPYTIPYEYSCEHSWLSTGAFALYIRKFVRELKILRLEEAIRKATSLPAQTFKIKDRGVLKMGAYADIVIFNHEDIRDNSDKGEPLRSPSGIEYVIVNGKVVMEKNQHTGVRSGKVLRTKR